MVEPSLPASIAALGASIVSFLRGESRKREVERRMEKLEAQMRNGDRAAVPQAICDERFARVQESQERLEKKVDGGFADLKELIREKRR